jgi:hypothetical protein
MDDCHHKVFADFSPADRSGGKDFHSCYLPRGSEMDFMMVSWKSLKVLPSESNWLRTQLPLDSSAQEETCSLMASSNISVMLLT